MIIYLNLVTLFIKATLELMCICLNTQCFFINALFYCIYYTEMTKLQCKVMISTVTDRRDKEREIEEDRESIIKCPCKVKFAREVVLVLLNGFLQPLLPVL